MQEKGTTTSNSGETGPSRRIPLTKSARSKLLGSIIVGAISLTFQSFATEPISCEANDHVTLSLAGPTTTLPSEPIFRFVNLSDTHILDDEASAIFTGNYLEAILEPGIGNGSAQRLQEEYTDEVLDAMEATINACDAQNPLELMIATGDLTDNATLNETRRYIDNLDGVSDQLTAFEANCGYATVDSNEHQKLGAPVCPVESQAATKVFTGRMVADSQAPAPDHKTSECSVIAGCDPSYQFTPTRSARQIAETYVASQAGLSHHIAPGLPPTLRCDAGTGSCGNSKLAVPHYAVFGNHDGYVRGTVTFQQAFQAGPAVFGRYFLESQREFINEFFYTQALPGPVGHGFGHAGARLLDSNDRNDGYYAWDAAGGKVRMIVINTITDGVRDELHRGGQTTSQTGGHVNGNEATSPSALETGSMSTEQFAWLQGELFKAKKPVLVFSHHPDKSWVERSSTKQFPLYPYKKAHELNELLGTYGNVVAHIAGHTHENDIRPCRTGPSGCLIGEENSGPQPNVANGFWRIETASLVDFPQEGRIVEMFELGPGKYALKLTMIRPDPHDPVADLSRKLSIAEAQCEMSQTLGGSLHKGPYDQARLNTMRNNGEAAIRGKFCYPGSEFVKAGAPVDRNTILFP